MAVIWERRLQGACYQVRTAGHSVRLYTNGVFHSQYNPQRPVTGNVWDLLFIPAFFRPPGAIRRVLVLGVGGGAVIRQLQHFVEPETIVGVERSAIHLKIARRFFEVRGAGVELVEADAVDWVRGWSGPPFDMIVDDLFGDDDGEPARAVQATGNWVGALVKCLAADGMIVSNFATRGELTGSAYQQLARFRRMFKSRFRLATPQNHNAVGVFLRTNATESDLRRRLCQIPRLNPDLKSTGLRYQLRVLNTSAGKAGHGGCC